MYTVYQINPIYQSVVGRCGYYTVWKLQVVFHDHRWFSRRNTTHLNSGIGGYRLFILFSSLCRMCTVKYKRSWLESLEGDEPVALLLWSFAGGIWQKWGLFCKTRLTPEGGKWFYRQKRISKDRKESPNSWIRTL